MGKAWFLFKWSVNESQQANHNFKLPLGGPLEILLDPAAIYRRQFGWIDIGYFRRVFLFREVLRSFDREMLQLVHQFLQIGDFNWNFSFKHVFQVQQDLVSTVVITRLIAQTGLQIV